MHKCFFLVPAMCAVLGCQPKKPAAKPPASRPAPCLTIADVTSIPPGNATGTKVWGTYRSLTNIGESCRECENHTVSGGSVEQEDTIDASVRTTFTQENGVLVGESTDGAKTRGAINADGSFVIGAIVTPIDYKDGGSSGQGLVLIEGLFKDDLIIAKRTSRMTMNTPAGKIDWQILSTETLQRVE